MSIQESTNRVIDYLEEQNIIPRNLREVEKVKLIVIVILECVEFEVKFFEILFTDS